MNGAGDADGEVSKDEAVWRDLIARFETPADPAMTEVPWPASEGLPGQAAAPAGPPAPDRARADVVGPELAACEPATDPGRGPDQPAVQPWARPGSGYVPTDRTRVIRSAGDPRSYSPPEEDGDDECYVPEPLPPPARMDPISKAALVGVIGGPGYLLVASVFLHWNISATAAFVAVAAFIAGFVTLVVKMGDRPRRDDDDDGAVL